MIEAHDLTRKFGDFTAVAGVSFALQEGEIVGILGPTAPARPPPSACSPASCRPTSGRVTLGGRDLFGGTPDAVAVRRDLGYLPENVALYPEMRVEEYLAYRARLEGHGPHRDPPPAGRGRSSAACSPTCAGRSSAPSPRAIASGSGWPRRSSTTRKVLILDEPTVGLDPKQIVAIRELIRELGRKHTLLLSTHILPEVELLCGRVLIFDRGRIVAEGSPDQLRERRQGQVAVTVEFEAAGDGMAEALAQIGGVRGVRSRRRRPASAPGALRARMRRRAPTRARRSSAWRSSARWTLDRARLGARLARGRLRPADDPRRAKHAGSEPRARRGGGMKGALAVFGRELRAYFFSPLAYVILTFFLLVRATTSRSSSPSCPTRGRRRARPLELFFGQTIFSWLVLIFAGTFLTMRLISEELRSGTIETLLTSPISETQVVARQVRRGARLLPLPLGADAALRRDRALVHAGRLGPDRRRLPRHLRHRRPVPRGRHLRLGDLEEPDGRRGRRPSSACWSSSAAACSRTW